MPKINLNLLRKLASLVTEVNSRWFWALKKIFASLKKILTFYASSIQQISIHGHYVKGQKGAFWRDRPISFGVAAAAF